ncbi:MAG: Gfo/Idh/MocA family oxidoreductase [Spirochaetales bacterium]|jgi:predicted dehydrogenase|nr:Gfo/Idh/MocA family oxidoreductase [Exilispira sp.]NMC66940.1 Gfo/Idh/MocA family oxidoreductase [Spirochaetales bacterium]
MVKIGVIGVGHMGEYHVNIIKQLESLGFVKFVGIYDINHSRMHFISNKYNVKAYSSAHNLLKDVDCITCAVNTDQHYIVAKEVLNAKVNLLIEKPFTTKYSEAEELVEISQKNNLKLQVGHVERFNGVIQELKKKYLKKSFYIEATRMNLYGKKNRDTGVILDLMVHDLDIILNYFDEDIIEISSFAKKIYTPYEDFAVATLLFSSGLIANFKCSRASYVKNRTLAIAQESNYLFLNFDTKEIEVYKDTSTRFEVDQKELIYYRGGFVERITVHEENALKDEIIHFINTVKGDQEQEFYNSNDLLVLKTALLIIKKASETCNIPYEGDL